MVGQISRMTQCFNFTSNFFWDYQIFTNLPNLSALFFQNIQSASYQLFFSAQDANLNKSTRSLFFRSALKQLLSKVRQILIQGQWTCGRTLPQIRMNRSLHFRPSILK